MLAGLPRNSGQYECEHRNVHSIQHLILLYDGSRSRANEICTEDTVTVMAVEVEILLCSRSVPPYQGFLVFVSTT